MKEFIRDFWIIPVCILIMFLAEIALADVFHVKVYHDGSSSFPVRLRDVDADGTPDEAIIARPFSRQGLVISVKEPTADEIAWYQRN